MMFFVIICFSMSDFMKVLNDLSKYLHLAMDYNKKCHNNVHTINYLYNMAAFRSEY